MTALGGLDFGSGGEDGSLTGSGDGFALLANGHPVARLEHW
jgi:hypothetical protein